VTVRSGVNRHNKQNIGVVNGVYGVHASFYVAVHQSLVTKHKQKGMQRTRNTSVVKC
jgi:hypothetical protein